jgi:hypothetical protein
VNIRPPDGPVRNVHDGAFELARTCTMAPLSTFPVLRAHVRDAAMGAFADGAGGWVPAAGPGAVSYDE